MKKLLLLLLLPFLAKAQVTDTTSKAYQLIKACRQRVVTKQSTMDKEARLYSEDPGSAQKGGLIMNVTRGTMVTEFEDVAYHLKPGEVSEIFETPYGYHFIELLERNGDALNLRHILIRYK